MQEEQLLQNTEDEDDDQELFEHFRFNVDAGQGLLRIDKYLMSRVENATRSKVQQAAALNHILVNNIPVKSAYKVKPGDVIAIMFTTPPRAVDPIPEDIPLDIVFEDDDLILVNKPAGMVVHPAYGNYTGTLVNALLFHFVKLAEEQGKQATRPFLVHRIDKDTSGILIVAKNEITQNKLQEQFFVHSIQRKYEALVWGDVKLDKDTITGNIARSKNNRKVFKVYSDPEIGKHAVSHFQVLERFGYVTLVECQLETGRTHQIRVHMQHIGHPLFNDSTYGGDTILRGTTFTKYKQFVQNCFKICPRQALHARSLGFIHPTTGKFMYFESELPQELNGLIEKWRNYAVHKNIENI